MNLKKSRTLLILLLYIFGMFFMPYLSNILLVGVLKLTDVALVTVLTNFISYIFLFLMVILLFKDDLRLDFKRISSPKHFFIEIMKGECLVYFAMIVSNLILLYGFNLTDNSQNQTLIEDVMVLHPILMSSTTVLLAPVIEEVVFRFTVMGQSKLNPTVALILSSVLFGLIHVVSAGDYIYVIPYLTMGLALGYVYKRSQNIWYPIGVHFLQNLLSTLLIFITL